MDGNYLTQGQETELEISAEFLLDGVFDVVLRQFTVFDENDLQLRVVLGAQNGVENAVVSAPLVDSGSVQVVRLFDRADAIDDVVLAAASLKRKYLAEIKYAVINPKNLTVHKDTSKRLNFPEVSPVIACSKCLPYTKSQISITNRNDMLMDSLLWYDSLINFICEGVLEARISIMACSSVPRPDMAWCNS